MSIIIIGVVKHVMLLPQAGLRVGLDPLAWGCGDVTHREGARYTPYRVCCVHSHT